jgi:hypothetical protein
VGPGVADREGRYDSNPYFHKTGRREVLVEREGLAEPAVPHDTKARRIDVGVHPLVMLAEPLRALERERPRRTADELSRAVFAKLAMKRTRRAAELVAEAIRVARVREPRAEITGSRWQASTSEVRSWALSAGFEPGSDGGVPEQTIAAYNQTHPDRPY